MTSKGRLVKWDAQILVAYATKHSATADIAKEISQVPRQAGLHTDVLPTDRVSDRTPYEAVVLGSVCSSAVLVARFGCLDNWRVPKCA